MIGLSEKSCKSYYVSGVLENAIHLGAVETKDLKDNSQR